MIALIFPFMWRSYNQDRRKQEVNFRVICRFFPTQNIDPFLIFSSFIYIAYLILIMKKWVHVNHLHVVYPGNQRIYCWANIDNLSDHIVRVLHQIRIVNLLTLYVVRGNFWVTTNGSPPCWWWGYQSAICIHDWLEMSCHFSLA